MPHGRVAASTKQTEILGTTTLRNVVVFDIDFTQLTALDRVARYILAAAYSSAYPGTDTYNQAYVAARTVAVALNGSSLYIAANSLWSLRSQSTLVRYRDLRLVGGSALLEALREENIIGTDEDNMFFLPNPYGDDDRDYHAEMQLVDYFYTQRLAFTTDSIGVSKPCCQLCAAALDRLGIRYSYWHSQPVGKTTKPCQPTEKWW